MRKPAQTPGNIIAIASKRPDMPWDAAGAASTYLTCISSGDPTRVHKARMIAHAVLDADSERQLFHAATVHVPSPSKPHLVRVAALMRRLAPVGPSLALLANGFDPCASLRRALKVRPPTLTAPPSLKAAART